MSDQAEREQDSSPADQVPPPGADASTSPGGLPGASALTESDRTGYRRWWRWAAGATAVAAAAAGTALYASAEEPVPVTAPAAPAVAPSASAGAEPVPSAARPPKGLPAVAYLTRVPAGLPADPAPMASALLTTVVRPQRTLAVYDRPGGRARILLPEEIHGVPVHVPLVRRRTGWVAVLLPSANRTVGWLPPGGWDTVTVRDQVVIRRKAHTLTWLRDGRVRGKWTVSVGSAASPTPLGRTFVFGRSTLGDPVYAGLDVLALGSVPDDPDSVPAGLRGAHIGIHSWHQNTFGGDTSDGCVQVPPAGHKLLLAHLAKGSGVLVLP